MGGGQLGVIEALSTAATVDPRKAKRPATSCLGRRPACFYGGDEGARTLDLRLAKPALSQLSYVPVLRAPNARARGTV
jgi:hypothetical protein